MNSNCAVSRSSWKRILGLYLESVKTWSFIWRRRLLFGSQARKENGKELVFQEMQDVSLKAGYYEQTQEFWSRKVHQDQHCVSNRGKTSTFGKLTNNLWKRWDFPLLLIPNIGYSASEYGGSNLVIKFNINLCPMNKLIFLKNIVASNSWCQLPTRTWVCCVKHQPPDRHVTIPQAVQQLGNVVQHHLLSQAAFLQELSHLGMYTLGDSSVPACLWKKESLRCMTVTTWPSIKGLYFFFLCRRNFHVSILQCVRGQGPA